MPLDLEIIRYGEFIRLGAEGHLDLAASRAVLLKLARACRKRGIRRALLDLREVRPGPTPMLSDEDLEALVNTFREAGFARKQRLAVLYSIDPHRRARQFAFMTSLSGWNVKASEDFESLLTWLSQGDKSERREEPEEWDVPVRIKRPAVDSARLSEPPSNSQKAGKPSAPPIRRPPATG